MNIVLLYVQFITSHFSYYYSHMHDTNNNTVYDKDRSECVELIVLLLYKNIVVIEYFLLANNTSMCIRMCYLR